jgi:hypothetical protein
MQQMQIQNGGFVSVRSIAEAQNYPVAPGNSVTFKDENAPYVYTKTMGFSQLDRPTFEVFRLVKEELSQTPNTKIDYQQQIDNLKQEIEGIKKLIDKEDVEHDEC